MMASNLTAMRLANDSSRRSLARRMKLTNESLRCLACPAGKDRVYVYDQKTPGMAVCITATGHLSFYLIRKIAGRAERIRLGGRELTIELARRKATKINGEIATGGDPMAVKRALRSSETLEQLKDRWLKDHAKPRLTAKTVLTDENRFDTCLGDWKSRRVLSITPADVRGLHLRLGTEKGHVSANRAVQLLRRLFNFARIGVNPVREAGIHFYRETTRDRFVQPDELPKLFKALDDAETNPTIRDFVYVALYTGARRSNVAQMHTDQLDLNSLTWTIPAGKSKNHEPMIVPLPLPAVEIIKKRLPEGGGFIFPGIGKSGHLEDPKATWTAVLNRAGLKNLRLHDLRRTLGSWQAAAGASLPIIGKSLGHRTAAATQIYSRLHIDPVRLSVGTAVDAMVAASKVEPKEQKP